MGLAPGTLVVLRQPFNQVLTLRATGSLASCETMACIWRLAILAVIVEIITKMFILMLLIIIITKNQWFDRKPFVWDFTAPGLPNPKRCLIDPNDIIIWIPIFINPLLLPLSLSNHLSSPRAESARAFTGRRNSHSGRGEDFLSRQPNFSTETVVTPERKVEKSFPMWEINRLAEG